MNQQQTKTIDLLIGTWCIENRRPLLHNDSDFRPMTRHLGLIELPMTESGPSKFEAVFEAEPGYDQMVVGAAKKWTYQPAMVDGKPVKFIKRLTISVSVAPQQ